MKKEELFDILGEVDEQKVADANKDFSKSKKLQKNLLKWGALAACLCIVYNIYCHLTVRHKIYLHS